MSHVIRLSILVLFIAFAGMYFIAGPSTGPINETVAASGPAEIYTANCARCHGADGRAQTAKGKRVEATDLTSDWNRNEARGIRIITNGKGEMPSFKKKLTAAEIRSVFNYVSTRFR